ncbi:hypothetical protein ACFFUP_10180 [Vibrio ostreicida]|uniref:Uncharacterized protein n=1 Tax=Vibrio ostreicida TaxID=526588 RepID=A0ABT8C1S9_9VIBR|nr:hypothetical protein [Vibrio ostreicida]MDN3612574.1 hypothetical protein [Vibrio ostreicida]NPD09195.1 hypothetical protein [Vibrio ostreicida]
MINKLKFVVPLSILMLGSAFLNASNTYGYEVEQAITFVSTLTAYIAIVALFAKWRDASIFSPTFIKYYSFLFIAITVLEAVYPAYIYRDQTLPPDYWTMFSIQLLLNLFIVKVINERN